MLTTISTTPTDMHVFAIKLPAKGMGNARFNFSMPLCLSIASPVPKPNMPGVVAAKTTYEANM